MILPGITILSWALLCVPHSLADTHLTGIYGKDMSAALKLTEVLPSTSITSLECAPQHLSPPCPDAARYHL